MNTRSAAYADLKYVPLGDQTLVVQFENKISIEVNRDVHAFAQFIEEQALPEILQVIITFNTLAISYNPIKTSFSRLEEKLRHLAARTRGIAAHAGSTIHIPVVFGGEYGGDVEELSVKAGLSPEELVRRLYSKPYYVYMVGFVDGTPYCGDIDGQLTFPRRSNPRLKVRRGSVAIANNQTTLYTIDSPGGWHLVGWTPMEVFNPYREKPGALSAGDYVQYVPIAPEESEDWDESRQREWDRQWNSSKS